MENKIQLISRNFSRETSEDITLSSFVDFKDFNSFNINVLDFDDKFLWNFNRIKDEYDQESLLYSLNDSIYCSNDKTIFILLIPQNLKISVGHYEEDYLSNNREIVTDYLNSISNISFSLIFGNSATKINEKEFFADFYFDKSNIFKVLLTNESGNPVIIQKNNFILTTLNIDDTGSLKLMINKINEINQNIDAPAWMEDIYFFRDNDQLNLIEIHKKEIKMIEEKINISKNILNENNKFKSVLYTKSDALVDVVFEMLEELLDCDLSGFVDVYDEDFFIEKDDVSFVGEIKGVNTNAKNKHLSQLNDHAEKKADSFKKKVNLKQILIINTFKDDHPNKRPEIEKETINKAKNMYGSLIIKTIDLLSLFEMFKKDLIDSNEIIERFKNDTGLFKL